MPEIQFLAFLDPKRKKCNCCDRTLMLTRKINFFEDDHLVGDLELCTTCAGTIAEILNRKTETVEKEWVFEGGEQDGKLVDAGEQHGLPHRGLNLPAGESGKEA